jgi:hypothetical protein
MARLVPVKTCLSLPEALVAESYLREHGVVTSLNGYHHASVAWHHLFALGGIRLSVLDIHLERARVLLATPSPMADDEEQAVADGVAVTPTQFEIAVALAASLLAMPLPLWVRRKYLDVE